MYFWVGNLGVLHPHPPLGMTPLHGVILEDLAPGVEVLMAGMTVAILSWAMGAMEAAWEAVTTAEKAVTRDSASTKCGGGDYSWNSFYLLGERGEEEKEEKKRKGEKEKKRQKDGA
ncbi:unnamed protein product [Cuscuta epithymum]|uniref:Uncharacterized protein n=1 Tax=Cuscuta epithymum TaxID=186058 RepID=A0AAV0FR01_9ASTE|nr:unnamed protein product [Cuscuta epithymum]CAH9138049.1 unnamed protein product [Cuscuta epithymum]